MPSLFSRPVDSVANCSKKAALALAQIFAAYPELNQYNLSQRDSKTRSPPDNVGIPTSAVPTTQHDVNPPFEHDDVEPGPLVEPEPDAKVDASVSINTTQASPNLTPLPAHVANPFARNPSHSPNTPPTAQQALFSSGFYVPEVNNDPELVNHVVDDLKMPALDHHRDSSSDNSNLKIPPLLAY